MSKFSFRTKALDNAKPLPIYLASEEPDILSETANINRAVPIMPTGMEKEEEEVGLARADTSLGGSLACQYIPHAS